MTLFSTPCLWVKGVEIDASKLQQKVLNMCSQNLLEKLNKIAYFKTTPFCYTCYEEAPTGICKTCSNDDLMRLKKDSGVEFDIDWVVEELIDENLNPIDSEELFEQMIDDCYGEEVQVGFLNLSTSQVMKDPIAWDIAKGEYMDGLEQDEEIISFDNGANYYWKYDVENYIEEVEQEMEEAA